MGRKLVEKDLKYCSDLCKWEENCYYSIESYKKTHQKLQKLVQKFNVNIYLILNHVATPLPEKARDLPNFFIQSKRFDYPSLSALYFVQELVEVLTCEMGSLLDGGISNHPPSKDAALSSQDVGLSVMQNH